MGSIRNIVIIIAVILVLYFGISFLFGGSKSSGEFTDAKVSTSKGSFEYHLEIADDNKERRFGLNNRSDMAQNEGMLYVFPTEEYWDMWTFESKMDLDVIWLDEDGIVVDFFEELPKCDNKEECLSYYPSRETKYAIEMKAGRVSEMDIQVGDKFALGI